MPFYGNADFWPELLDQIKDRFQQESRSKMGATEAICTL